MSWVALGVGVGGTVIGGLGSAIGAGSSNRAARRAGDEFETRAGQGMDRLGGFLFGQPWLQQRQQAGATNIDASGANIAGSLFGSGSMAGYNNRTLNRGMQMYNRGINRFNRDAGMIGGLASGGEQMAMGAGRNIDQLGMGAETMARQYGAGSNAIIDQETARALQAANAISQARMNATGMGNSTLVSNALSGNAVQANLGAARQKSDIQRQMTELLMGARQNRVGAAQQSANRTQGARNVNIDTQRALTAARTGLGTQRAGLFMDQRNRNADVMMGAMGGPVMNFALGGNYNPGVGGRSVAGSALAGAGTVLAGLGGSGLFSGRSSGMTPQQMAEYLQSLQVPGI